MQRQKIVSCSRLEQGAHMHPQREQRLVTGTEAHTPFRTLCSAVCPTQALPINEALRCSEHRRWS